MKERKAQMMNNSDLAKPFKLEPEMAIQIWKIGICFYQDNLKMWLI